MTAKDICDSFYGDKYMNIYFKLSMVNDILQMKTIGKLYIYVIVARNFIYLL